jgi:hypothetical protein
MRRHTTGLLTFVVLGLAAVMGALCFHAVAQAKGIHDARAMQVSTFYAKQLLALWLVGWTCRSERARRMFVAGCFGVMGESGFAGALAVGLAHADLHVTPPFAWLGLSLIGGLSFAFAARRARGS